ncbi:MAG: YgiT-type zinc finger protein [Thermomicrobiales bacterium]
MPGVVIGATMSTSSSQESPLPEDRCQGPSACTACGGETVASTGELIYQMVDYTITVLDVPMKICLDCEERYIPGRVGIIVGDLVANMVEAIERTEISQHVRSSPTSDLRLTYQNVVSDELTAS